MAFFDLHAGLFLHVSTFQTIPIFVHYLIPPCGFVCCIFPEFTVVSVSLLSLTELSVHTYIVTLFIALYFFLYPMFLSGKIFILPGNFPGV